MDGDSTAKTLDNGANSAIKTMNDTDGIHEASHQAVCLFSPVHALTYSLLRLSL